MVMYVVRFSQKYNPKVGGYIVATVMEMNRRAHSVRGFDIFGYGTSTFGWWEEKVG